MRGIQIWDGLDWKTRNPKEGRNPKEEVDTNWHGFRNRRTRRSRRDLDFVLEEGHSAGVKRVWIAIVVVCVALAGVIGWQVVKTNDEPEPVYKGRTLTSWLEDYSGMSDLGVLDSGTRDATEAVHHAGTNAIPTLLRMLRAKDSPLKSKLIVLAQRHHIIKFRYYPAEVKNWQAAGCYGPQCRRRKCRLWAELAPQIQT
jgi:hypothetical protein